MPAQYGPVRPYDTCVAMIVQFHPHAMDRLAERGATKDEVQTAIETGEQFPAKFGRTGFRRNFPYERTWHGKYFAIKQIEAYASKEDDHWLVVTVITRYF